MVKPSKLILLILIAGAAVWGWIAMHPSPEKQVRKQLQALARTASYGSGQGLIGKVADAEKLVGYFASNVNVNIDVPGHHESRFAGRDEIQQASLAVRNTVRSMSISFPDITVIVNADNASAVADATLEAKIAGESDLIVQEVKFHFRKVESDWLIDKIETVKTLQ